MGFFSALAAALTPKPILATADRKQGAAFAADIPGPGGYNFEVIGESKYQNRFRANLPDEFTKPAAVRCYVVARLEIDDDPDAQNHIIVKLGYSPVGHIPEEDVRSVRQMIKQHGRGQTAASCRAVVVKRNGSYGIWLDLSD
ncbi:hypothetical protein [Jeongeupia sp. USM3]|uniref:hypothetical protein n=1 Tax=Jeongeupia sp. USM3 TaxID=1906741 RepID=UPI00089DE40C|nr:hypothetical protein [Jeongeupia sp. USM3]AOY00123.1 hypothetical protein BJP62_06455 [Jeongeupia sp. USM3]